MTPAPSPARSARVLAVDIGGTKTDLAVIEASDPRSIVRRATYASGDHLDFEQILDLFLARNSAGSMAT